MAGLMALPRLQTATDGPSDLQLRCGRSLGRPWNKAYSKWQRKGSRGKSGTPSTCSSVWEFELLTSTEFIVLQGKDYFKDILNPTNKQFEEEADMEDFGLGFLITVAGSQDLSNNPAAETLGVDEICPKFLKYLNVGML